MNNTDRERLGEALCTLRRTAGLTIREVADATKIAPSTISDIERGKRDPMMSTVLVLAKHYGVKVKLVDKLGITHWRSQQ